MTAAAIVLPERAVNALAEHAVRTSGAPLEIDLEALRVTGGGFDESFEIDPASRHRLLNGLDDIGLILQHEAAIARYESGISNR